MDVERTIEFILTAQAKAEDRMEKMDRRIDGITKLLHQGMRMLVRTDAALADLAQAQRRTERRVAELAQSQKELAQSQKELVQSQKVLARSQRELAQSQKATERTLKIFIQSLRPGRNGQAGR